MSSADSDLITPLLERLEAELRQQAWAIVESVVEAERRRRMLVLDTVAQAFDAALAQPSGGPPRTAQETDTVSPPAGRDEHVLSDGSPSRGAPIMVERARPRPPGIGPCDGARSLGVVKWFNEVKGFGFIIGADGAEVFVHYKNVAGEGFRSLDEGMRVSYVPGTGPRGRFAIDVRPAG